MVVSLHILIKILVKVMTIHEKLSVEEELSTNDYVRIKIGASNNEDLTARKQSRICQNSNH
jgi:hypothetical protein